MDVAPILVTGGTGLLGRRVADRLRAAGRDVRVLSRGGGNGVVRGDLATGAGLDEAVRGAAAIIHCASNPTRDARRVEVEGTGHLLRAAASAGVPHVVYVSIVGVDRNPNTAYYRAKRDAEEVVARGPVPWTILRATQFHDFVLQAIRRLECGPLLFAPRDFLLQPIDAGEVAGRLVALALGVPAGRIPDLGGPEVRTLANLARAYLAAAGTRLVVEVPVPGRAARAFRAGAQTCSDGDKGTTTWEAFLRGRMAQAAMCGATKNH